MKPIAILILALSVFGGAACSLVTVPVRVAGGIVETTVKTTGKVVSAPFNAMGRRKGDDREPEAPKKQDSTTDDSAPAPSAEGEAAQ